MSPLENSNVFKFIGASKASVSPLPVATASPVASAAEQQQQHDDKQEHVHRIPPFKMRRGGIALPMASAILYAFQIQFLAELNNQRATR
jgi:hypothetical protein